MEKLKTVLNQIPSTSDTKCFIFELGSDDSDSDLFIEAEDENNVRTSE